MCLYSANVWEHIVIVANKLDILGKYDEADEVDKAFMDIVVGKNVVGAGKTIKKLTKKVEYYINEA